MQDRATRTRATIRVSLLLALVTGLASFIAVGSVLAVADVQTHQASQPKLTAAIASSTEPAGEAIARDRKAPDAVAAALVATPPSAPESGPAEITIEGELRPGDALGRALHRSGVTAGLIHRLTRALAEHYDFRRSQPGHAYRVVLDAEGELLDFRYLTSKTDGFHVFPVDGVYRVERDEAQLVAIVSRITGTVATSLYDAVRALGASTQLASDFTDIFAWDIDFSRAVHRGDEFRVLYERLYSVRGDGSREFVRPGRILAAQYKGSGNDYTAVYFEQEEGRGGYFRPDGTSVERSFLLSPLRYGRISSRYTSARRHPILKVTRPHYGIDYAAPTGTPVWAVADGRVIYRSRAGGFGNLVKVRHANGFVSYYSHLSRFPKGLRVGDRVQQKQLVGYVGATGLATGPHVCFRVTHKGKYVDPLRLRVPEGRPVGHEVAHLFQGTRDILLAELDGAPLFAVDDAL